MVEKQLDKLNLGAELEVNELTGCPGGAELQPPPEKIRKDVIVTMETRTLEEEEEHWRRLFPDIKKCVIVICPSPSQLKMKREDRRRSKQVRSCDPGPQLDWMKPLESNHGVNKSMRFVKKVKVQAEHAPDDGPWKPQKRLRLARCPSVTFDSAHLQLHNNTNNEDLNTEQQTTDHNYSSHTERKSQSQDPSQTSTCGHKDKDRSSFPAENNNLTSLVLKKVQGQRWVLRSSKDDEEEEKNKQMVLRKKTADPASSGPTVKEQEQKLKRRLSCGRCLPCLRKDCMMCHFCRDMKKFGGPSRLKKRCLWRQCENIGRKYTTEPDDIQLPEETVTTATPPEPYLLRKPIVERNAAEPEERWKRCSGPDPERRRRAVRKSQLSPEGSEPKMMDEEKETPQEVASIILPQFLLPVGPLELLPGTHLQVNLPLDGSHLPPGIPSDSALTCLPGLLPQEGSVLPVSKGLAAPAAVQSVHPKKEEEEPVEIDLYWRGGAGRWQEEEEEEEKKEVCADRVSDRRKFYEVEVELPDFDFNTETLTAPALSDETKAFEAPDPAHKRPEFISLNSWSFNLFRGGASHSPAGGRGLVCLLQALRRTVLPAHWVAVLADRPELQLLQCSKLSSMTDTIVHVQPDRSFYISIQNQRLPETHRVFEAHTHRVSHLSQLVSLLLHLEQLVVCRGSRVRSSACQRVQSPACHLLVAPPLRTCLSCLLEEGSEEEESEEEEEDEDETTVMRPS